MSKIRKRAFLGCIASRASLIAMDNLMYATICSPLSVFATILNISFLFCLHKPPSGVHLCQPLCFLIIAMLCNSTVQQCLVALTVISCFLTPPDWLLVIARSLTYQTFCANFASNAWISIFYCMKVVPQRRAISVWLKRNIKVTAIYFGYVLKQLILIASMYLGAASFLVPLPASANLTFVTLNGTKEANEQLGAFLYKLTTVMFLVYVTFPFCALSLSWGRTYIYLRGHMKRMEKSSSPFSHPQQQNHMRVTVMGILQTALFIPSCLWSLAISIMYSSPLYRSLDANKHITLTITSASGLGNIACLGFSQSVFRLRVAAVLEDFKKWIGWSERLEENKV